MSHWAGHSPFCGEDTPTCSYLSQGDSEVESNGGVNAFWTLGWAMQIMGLYYRIKTGKMKVPAKHLHTEPKQRQQTTEMKERLRLVESVTMKQPFLDLYSEANYTDQTPLLRVEKETTSEM